MVVLLQLDLLWATHMTTSHYLIPTRSQYRPRPIACSAPRARAVRTCASAGRKVTDKPSICTADELHYVPVPNSLWRLALWRYTPSPQGPKRNHPLLLLSGVGTNAIGYDLGAESSFARYMSSQGFDTWTLEVRGAGLSREEGLSESEQPAYATSVIKQDMNNAPPMESAADRNFRVLAKSEISPAKGRQAEAVNKSHDLQLSSTLTDSSLSERLSCLGNGGLLQTRLSSSIASQVKDWSKKILGIIEEVQQTFSLQKKVSSPAHLFQKQFNKSMKYHWDFDHYLEEDVPAAMEYVTNQCQPKDNKLLAIGHSMGGILLYAMLSRNAYAGRNCGLASVVTLGSSLDYTTSRSSLKLLLPLLDPAQALSVPVIPIGALLAAAYPLASRPPYFLSWLNQQISAQDMMHPEMFEKLVLNNFGTVPAKLLLQLATVFQEGGLCDRSRSFFFKNHLHKIKVPVLALAGDQDTICPPEAVYETIKQIPEHFVTFKVVGEPGGPHYAHYDLVASCLASDQVYPCIIKHLSCHDVTTFPQETCDKYHEGGILCASADKEAIT